MGTRNFNLDDQEDKCILNTDPATAACIRFLLHTGSFDQGEDDREETYI